MKVFECGENLHRDLDKLKVLLVKKHMKSDLASSEFCTCISQSWMYVQAGEQPCRKLSGDPD